MRLFFMPSSDIPHPEEAGRAQAWTGVSKDARCLCSATRTLLRRLGRLRPGAGRHVDLAAHQLARGPEGAGGAQGDAALAGVGVEQKLDHARGVLDADRVDRKQAVVGKGVYVRVNTGG